MKLTKKHYVGIAFGIAILIADIIFLRGQAPFFFFLGLAFVVAALPFLVALLVESGREKEKEEMFLEFCRDLAQSVNAGIPVNKAIENVSEKNFGTLSKHIKKLNNQISLGIPVRRAFEIFARDTRNNVIKSGVGIIVEAEESGGEIASTLESVARTVREIEDLKKERKSAVYSQIVKGYIIFFTFIAIMLILQIWLLPELVKTLAATGGTGGGGSGFGEIVGGRAGEQIPEETLKLFDKVFLLLIVLQGFFTGLVIGKLSEGNIKSGLKHSIFLVAISYLIITGTTAFKPFPEAPEGVLPITTTAPEAEQVIQQQQAQAAATESQLTAPTSLPTTPQTPAPPPTPPPT